MNGVGPDTTIKPHDIKIVVIPKTLAIVFSVLFVLSLVLWILKKRKFNQTEICVNFKEYKKEYKAQKSNAQGTES